VKRYGASNGSVPIRHVEDYCFIHNICLTRRSPGIAPRTTDHRPQSVLRPSVACGRRYT
jgi:hypothetical protein